MEKDVLDALFGKVIGDTPDERAKNSPMLYVEGEHLLTIDESSKATGTRISASEALIKHGIDKLLEILDKGSAVINS